MKTINFWAEIQASEYSLLHWECKSVTKLEHLFNLNQAYEIGACFNLNQAHTGIPLRGEEFPPATATLMITGGN